MARRLRQNLRTLMPEGLEALGYLAPETPFQSDVERDYYVSVPLLSFYEDFRQRVLRHSVPYTPVGQDRFGAVVARALDQHPSDSASSSLSRERLRAR